MNAKIKKIDAQIEAIIKSIESDKLKLKHLRRERKQVENEEIIGVIRSLDITPEELPALLEKLKSNVYISDLEENEGEF